MEPDKKAVQILKAHFWSSAGWRDELSPATSTDEDIEYAKAAGVMFEPVSLDHDEAVQWLLRSFAQVAQEDVVAAFVSSLGSRRLDLRSALGSFAMARHFPHHRHQERGICEVCGTYGLRDEANLNVLNFERFKWGGVRHDQAEYAAFDLERFSESTTPEPSVEDYLLLRDIVEAASSLPVSAKLSDLVKVLSPIIKSNANERRVLIQILGYAGVLQPRNKPGFFREFVPWSDREVTPWSKDDWSYPVQWWRGRDGVNTEALLFWFPKLGAL